MDMNVKCNFSSTIIYNHKAVITLFPNKTVIVCKKKEKRKKKLVLGSKMANVTKHNMNKILICITNLWRLRLSHIRYINNQDNYSNDSHELYLLFRSPEKP